MDDSVYPLFPVPSCVVFGRKRATSKLMPDTVTAYSGTLPYRDAPEDVADKVLTVTPNAPKPAEGVFEGGSAYRSAFKQGATLVPRMLCLVEYKTTGRLGTDPTAPFVMSRRTNQEKEPWKSLPGIEHRVEAEFLHPVLLGESILPYRVFRPFEGVVPVTKQGEILDAKVAGNRGHSGLRGWMTTAEKVWNANRPSAITLVEQFDYYGKLRSQFPIASARVCFAASGTLPAACVLRESNAIIEHAVYWAPSETKNEADYLSAVLNSEETSRARAANMQSRGQFGARHFDKVMFTLPIPRFDRKNGLHGELADAAREAEKVAAGVELSEAVKFQRARRLVRDALAEAGIAQRIDALVARLLEK
jgi:hypothetical protein